MQASTRASKVLLGLSVALLAGCRAGERGRPPATLVVAQVSPVLSLDPTVNDSATLSALSNVYESLVAYDHELRLVPGLPSAWRTPDETTWDFDLRRDATFHDGSLVRAADVAQALERARRSPSSGVRGAFWTVAAIEASGPTSVRIRTERPDALLLHQLTQVLIARGSTREEIERTPLGTGPYRVVRWEKGGSLDLAAVRLPESAPGAPRSVRFVAPRGGDAAILGLSTGELDIAALPPTAVLARPRPVFRLLSDEGLSVQFLWIDTRRQPGRTNPLADVRVRRAVVLALDRAEIAGSMVGHQNRAVAQAVPRAVFGHDPSLVSLPFDPAAALRLMSEAGFPRGFATSLAHSDNAQTTKVAGLVAGMLGRLGIRVQLRPLPWEALLAGQARREFPLYLMRWVFDSGDAAAFFRDTVASPGPNRGTANPGYSSPLADSLVEDAVSTFNASVRQATLQRLGRLVQEEVPFVPLYRQPDTWGAGPRVTWTPRPDGRLLAVEVTLGSGTIAR